MYQPHAKRKAVLLFGIIEEGLSMQGWKKYEHVHERYAGAPSCWEMISLSEIWRMSGNNPLRTFSQ